MIINAIQFKSGSDINVVCTDNISITKMTALWTVICTVSLYIYAE